MCAPPDVLGVKALIVGLPMDTFRVWTLMDSHFSIAA